MVNLENCFQKSTLTGETALSLEFYDRSAQAILDEYLLDFIDYETFLDHSHPPANHIDYRPLIDFCKANNLPVIAANCSRRHSRLMSRQGPEAIEKLAEESEIHRNFLLPTLPVQPASQQYEANFRATMGIVGKKDRHFIIEEQTNFKTNPICHVAKFAFIFLHLESLKSLCWTIFNIQYSMHAFFVQGSEGLDDNRITRMLGAQSLWDATMAHSIIKALYRANLVVHVAGYFHIKSNLGIPEHLAHYGGSLEYGQTSIVMLPEEDLVFTESEHKNAADLVVLTDINAIDL